MRASAKSVPNGPSSTRRQAKTRQNTASPPEVDQPDPSRPTSRWTFLTNHSHVLIILHAEPELVLREVAARVGITERAVQRVVQELEQDGFLRRERVGRKNRYEVMTESPLRHPIEAHRKIGDLLHLISG
ncbi:MAG: helix-turn-helix domain-containing protein [Planctomycetota bacterium]